MKNEREYPRYDIRAVSRPEGGFAAFLIDHDTGDTWRLDANSTWKKLRRASVSAKTKRARRKR
jgi:hypothetical protein